MQANFRLGPWALALATCAVLGAAIGQDREGGTRTAPASEGSSREGGIPKRFAQPRDRDRQEGLEEGMPDVQSQPGFREALPRWVPPRGDWKLGVWAYNTDSGVVITRVLAGSPAANDGLEPGDRIVSVGGYQVGFVGDVLYPLGFEVQRQAGPRGQLLLLVQNVRNQELMNLSVQLERPGRVRPLPRERE